MSASEVTAPDGEVYTGTCGTCGATIQSCSICHSEEMVYGHHDCQSSVWYCQECYARNHPKSPQVTQTDVGVMVGDGLTLFLRLCNTIVLSIAFAVIALVLWAVLSLLTQSPLAGFILAIVACFFIFPRMYRKVNRGGGFFR